jgi:hypothetical protein
MEPTVIITTEEYNFLLEKAAFLDCLIAQGVDNWCGYGDAQDMMKEES